MQQYAWGRRGGCSYLKKFNENFVASSWIAFSQNMFYLIMVKRGTIKSWDFLEFLKVLLCARSKMSKINTNGYVLIMDNASIHKTRDIK